jgi:hypothetical protein
MHAAPYNPCRNGLAAKIWECLRRNQAFRERITFLHNQRAKIAAMPPDKRYMPLESDDNVFADAALRHLLPLDHDDRPEEAKFDLDTPWPKVPKEFRDEIEWLLKRHLPMPFTVERPPLDLFFKREKAEGDRVRVADWRAGARKIWDANDIVAVPKYVHDSRHRRAIIRDLMSRIRLTPREARTLENAGSFLGTEMDWLAFLSIESRIPPVGDLSEGDAVAEVAWQLYENDSWKPRPPRAGAQLNRWLQDLKAVASRRGGKIRDRLHAVGAAIASVYPGLGPFQ